MVVITYYIAANTARTKSVRNSTQYPRGISTKLARIIKEDVNFYKTNNTDGFVRVKGQTLASKLDSPGHGITNTSVKDEGSKLQP